MTLDYNVLYYLSSILPPSECIESWGMTDGEEAKEAYSARFADGALLGATSE